MPTFGNRYFEDPTVARVAALEYERVWERIEERTKAGEWFYRARELVLAEEIRDISKAFGSVVASRVAKAIQQTDPDDFDWTRMSKAERAEVIERVLLRSRGKVGWINKVSLKLLGWHLW